LESPSVNRLRHRPIFENSAGFSAGFGRTDIPANDVAAWRARDRGDEVKRVPHIPRAVAFETHAAPADRQVVTNKAWPEGQRSQVLTCRVSVRPLCIIRTRIHGRRCRCLTGNFRPKAGARLLRVNSRS
jgi:hypothetical protein